MRSNFISSKFTKELLEKYSKELEKSRTDDLLPSVAAITEDEEEENSADSSNDSGQMKLF